MDTAAEKTKPAFERSNLFLSMISVLRRAERWLAGLVTLTEEERIKAGVYFGHERPQG